MKSNTTKGFCGSEPSFAPAGAGNFVGCFPTASAGGLLSRATPWQNLRLNETEILHAHRGRGERRFARGGIGFCIAGKSAGGGIEADHGRAAVTERTCSNFFWRGR